MVRVSTSILQLVSVAQLPPRTTSAQSQHGVLCKAMGCAECGCFHVQHYCSASGRWGYMEPQRWQTFLKWLHDGGLLTTAAPSRNPVRSPRSTNAFLVIHLHICCWPE